MLAADERVLQDPPMLVNTTALGESSVVLLARCTTRAADFFCHQVGLDPRDLNARPMKKLGGVSRRDLFERIERAELKPLPPVPFEPAITKLGLRGTPASFWSGRTKRVRLARC